MICFTFYSIQIHICFHYTFFHLSHVEYKYIYHDEYFLPSSSITIRCCCCCTTAADDEGDSIPLPVTSSQYPYKKLVSDRLLNSLKNSIMDGMVLSLTVTLKTHTAHTNTNKLIKFIAPTTRVTFGRFDMASKTFRETLNPFGPPGLFTFRFIFHLGLTIMVSRNERWKPMCSHCCPSFPALYLAPIPLSRISPSGYIVIPLNADLTS
mmetsp:Transcript_29369/g.44420  ORF Transcript_29369/g.44420 Transcript_29369/m.44420 type:complete len:208 (+) Transcript_29369:38-661(+)